MQAARGKNKRPPPREKSASFATQQSRPQGKAQGGKPRKRRRHGSNAPLYMMVLLMMLTIGVILIFTVFFKVINIEVEGLTRYSKQEVVASSGIVPEVNMFRLRRSEIADKLVKEYSYFEEVRLKLGMPDSVTIQVKEALPVGAIQQGETYLLFSAAGRVLETQVAQPPPELPIVKGFNALTLKAGERLDESKAEELNMLDAFVKAQQETGFANVRYIDVSDKFNLIIGYNDKVVIELGSEAELTYKIQCVQKVLTDRLEADFEGKIDASYPGKVRVRRLNLEAQDMTADEYAEYLYQKNGGVADSATPSLADSATSSLADSAQSSTAQKPEAVPSQTSTSASSEEESTSEEET